VGEARARSGPARPKLKARRGKSGRTPPRPVAPPQPVPDPSIRIDSPAVAVLAKKSGISLEAALAVTQGLTTVEKALENLKPRHDLLLLAEEHNLPHSLAGQVLKEQITIAEALVRAHVIAHRRAHGDDCSLAVALEEASSRIFGLHGQRLVRASVVENLKFDVKLLVEGDEGQEPKEELIQKHEIKFLYLPEHRKAVRKTIKEDKELSGEPRGPIVKVAKRFRLKDEMIQRIIDLRSHLDLTLLEGEHFVAEVATYSKYEVVLRLRDEALLTIFRHAIHEAHIVPLEEVLAAQRYAKKMKQKGGGGKKGKKKRRH